MIPLMRSLKCRHHSLTGSLKNYCGPLKIDDWNAWADGERPAGCSKRLFSEAAAGEKTMGYIPL
jgi:hypothetical protein